MKYSEKFKDPRWQKKRLKILERDEFTCQSCFDNESTLHVHHKYYEYGKDPWDYNNEALVTLCEDCHEYETKNMKKCQHTFLVCACEAGLLSDDLINVAHGFYANKFKYPPEVFSNVIEWVMTDEKEAKKLTDAYFKYLKAAKKRSSK